MFSRQYLRYNLLLTAAEFVSLELLRSYWSESYAAGCSAQPVRVLQPAAPSVLVGTCALYRPPTNRSVPAVREAICESSHP